MILLLEIDATDTRKMSVKTYTYTSYVWVPLELEKRTDLPIASIIDCVHGFVDNSILGTLVPRLDPYQKLPVLWVGIRPV